MTREEIDRFCDTEFELLWVDNGLIHMFGDKEIAKALWNMAFASGVLCGVNRIVSEASNEQKL